MRHVTAHFYLTVTGKPEIEFQAELFLRSLEMFEKDFVVTVCGNASRYMRKRAEVIPLPSSNFDPSWYASFGCVPKKGDVTVYTDADVMVLGNLKFNADTVCGVIAYASPKIEWKKLFDDSGIAWPRKRYRHSVDGGECPYYPNLGFVSVPSGLVPHLNELMPHFLKKSNQIFPGHYHRPQFAMCLALEYLKAPRVAMPIEFNFPDLYSRLDGGEANVAHLLRTKSEVRNWKELREFVKKPPRNRLMEKVQAKMKFILNTLAI